MKIQLRHSYNDVISIENFLLAWKEFIKNKIKRKDVQEFRVRLMDNIITLHQDLANKTYKHGGYKSFKVNDPKPRDIHKAGVSDRLLHHAIYRILYPFFDKTFIADSYSCRLNRGTHRGIRRFKNFSDIVSKNNTKTCFVLKCDIRKFFANIDHGILMSILLDYIPDSDILNLLEEIIKSFSANPGAGLPLGNLTSQLFANVYMNRFDQFVKHKLKAKYYVRYCDDFVILSDDRLQLEMLLLEIKVFLKEQLKLELHPDKVYIKTMASGVDFLGWVNFCDHCVLRTSTKKQMANKLQNTGFKEESVNSYLGLLRHGNSYKLQRKILADFYNQKATNGIERG